MGDTVAATFSALVVVLWLVAALALWRAMREVERMRVAQVISVAKGDGPLPAPAVSAVPAGTVYMLHGCGGWARYWARERGWRPTGVDRWQTEAGVTVVGVIDPLDLLFADIGATFFYGPFPERELILAARAREMVEVDSEGV